MVEEELNLAELVQTSFQSYQSFKFEPKIEEKLEIQFVNYAKTVISSLLRPPLISNSEAPRRVWGSYSLHSIQAVARGPALRGWSIEPEHAR